MTRVTWTGSGAVDPNWETVRFRSTETTANDGSNDTMLELDTSATDAVSFDSTSVEKSALSPSISSCSAPVLCASRLSFKSEMLLASNVNSVVAKDSAANLASSSVSEKSVSLKPDVSVKLLKSDELNEESLLADSLPPDCVIANAAMPSASTPMMAAAMMAGLRFEGDDGPPGAPVVTGGRGGPGGVVVGVGVVRGGVVVVGGNGGSAGGGKNAGPGAAVGCFGAIEVAA